MCIYGLWPEIKFYYYYYYFYNNVHDSHHMYTRSIYNDRSIKLRKYISHISITGKGKYNDIGVNISEGKSGTEQTKKR